MIAIELAIGATGIQLSTFRFVCRAAQQARSIPMFALPHRWTLYSRGSCLG